MKRIAVILLTLLMLGCTALAEVTIDLTQMTPAELEALIAAAEQELTMQEDRMIERSIELVKDEYTTYYAGRYDSYERFGGLPLEGYLEIIDTKVYYIKDVFQLPDEDDQAQAEALFGDVQCLVCFSLYSDIGMAPYYPNIGMFDSVAVYKDGSMEVDSNPFLTYGYNRYKFFLRDVIASVSDRGSDFNNTWYLLK